MIEGSRAARQRRLLIGLLAAAAIACAICAAPAFATGECSGCAPWWHLSSSSTPTYLAPGQEGTIVVTALNLGDASVNASPEHKVTISDRLPPGLTVTGLTPTTCSPGTPASPMCARKWPSKGTIVQVPECSVSTVSCTFEEPLAPYEEWEMDITVKVEAGVAHSGSENEVKVEGGETKSASLERPITVSSEPVPFGISEYAFEPEGLGGVPETQAGSHPFQLTTTLAFNRINYDFLKGSMPSVPALPKDVRVSLPPGLIGNPTEKVAPRCSDRDFTTVSPEGVKNICPASTVIGVATATLTEPLNVQFTRTAVPVFNLVPPKGVPARFGFTAAHVPVTLDAVVQGGDYHVVVDASSISQLGAVLESDVTLWGVPGDPRHDQSRGWACLDNGVNRGSTESCENHPLPHEPFLTLPTSCTGPLQTSVDAESWVQGATFQPGPPASTESLAGCAGLPFGPSLEVTPEQTTASTPTGLSVDLKVPQDSTLEPTLEEDGRAEADLKDATVHLPAGVQLSPSAADGLAACSTAMIGFTGVNALTGTDEFSTAPAACPKESKVGTVRIHTPLLEHELEGSVYLAAEHDNPFGSLFAIYVVIDDEQSGVRVKLAGKVTLDEATGQISTTFPNAPQLPFDDFKLLLSGGPRASLATPRACGSYQTSASFTPWSGAPSVQQALDPAEFAITSGPDGTPCPNPLQPFNPTFLAGTTNNQAGAFTPFTLSITRPDTDQQLKSISMTLPPGLAGLLSAVKLCGEPQAADGTCGPESLIGSATAVAGLGTDPFTETGGRVYITGPYEGAPFGLSIVIPAVAGPFDFGYVVTRSAISVDPNTAAITVTSTLPTMLNTTTYRTGVPVQLRRVDVTVERPGNQPFQFNPTNCSPMSIGGTLGGDQGTSAHVSTPFQVAGCDRLPFAPKFTASTGAQASKVGGASLKVNVRSPGLGQANIAKVKLQLPLALPSRLTTIQKACPEAVFAANPATCDEGSVIGRAIIHTPVLNSALSGPAYLVSHGGAAFPDVEFVLQGEGVTVILDGKTDIKKGITYSRFESAPDAPFTTFETELPTGPHSALTAYLPAKENFNLCKTHLLMPTEITGQNGDRLKQTTKIAVTGCKKPLTRAQLLARALKACRHQHNRAKRGACERLARKRFAPPKPRRHK